MRNSQVIRTKGYRFYFTIAVLTLFIQSCIDKPKTNTWSKFPYQNEVEINDSCIYLIHSGGALGTSTVIELNPLREQFNTVLFEFDSYKLNGHPIKISKKYSIHIASLTIPHVESIEQSNKKIIEQYSQHDTLVGYVDYSFYLPKQNKMFWINVFDGINKNESVALAWIQNNISKISLKENINYQMLTKRKKSYTSLSLDSLDRSYLIPTKELTNLPRYFSCPR
jgi:ABC-type phosphate transport system substrate-binding protein